MDSLRLARVALPRALGTIALSACPSNNTVGDDAGYASGERDLTTASRAMVADLRAYLGLTP